MKNVRRVYKHLQAISITTWPLYHDARCDGNEKFDVFEVGIQGSSRMALDPPISALRVVLIG